MDDFNDAAFDRYLLPCQFELRAISGHVIGTWVVIAGMRYKWLSVDVRDIAAGDTFPFMESSN